MIAAVLFAAGFAAFLPALRAGFVDFDDPGVLFEDTGWQGLSPDNIRWMFTTFRLGHYHPLTYLSYAIEHVLFGSKDPAVFHATNMLIHAGNAVLVWLVVRRILAAAVGVGGGEGGGDSAGAPPKGPISLIAGGAALVWAVHPLRVESVAWITERRDVLSTFFLLLTTLTYLRAFPRGSVAPASWARYWGVVGLLLVSLLCKAWGMTFFVVATLMDVYPLRRLPVEPWRWLSRDSAGVLLQKAPFAVLGVACALVAGVAQSASHATVKTLAEWTVVDRLLQACYGLVFYPWKTLAPVGLSPLYELPMSITRTDARWLVPAALVAVAVPALVVIVRRKPAVTVAFAAYAVLVAPVLGVFQSGIQLVADRYSYVSTIPLLALAAGGVAVVASRAKRPGDVLNNAAAGLLVVCGVLAMITWGQTKVWQASPTIWQRALAVGQDGALIRCFNADQISVAAERERTNPARSNPERVADLQDRAIAEYRKSLEFNPKHAAAWFGLACNLRDRRQYPEAAEAFTRAIEYTSVKSKPRVGLGLMYINRMDRADLALEQFRLAVKDIEDESKLERPTTGIPYLLLGGALDQTGDGAGAVEMLRKAAAFPDTKAQAEDHLRTMGK